MKKTWDPLPSAVSAGFTTVDLSTAEAGKLNVVKWRGKPVFILKHTDDMAKNDDRDVIVGSDRFTVAIGLCTHLGCIPSYEENNKQFKCACHGGEFSASGVQKFGPPPRPLDIPPFALNGTTLVLGEEDAQYKKLHAVEQSATLA
jgi:ubiquinol-cytochrome c reductase iron-sulfur subunit